MPDYLQHSALVFLILTAPAAIVIIWTDLRYMKIPNLATGYILAVFAVAGLFVLPLDIWAWRWVSFALVLAVGFVAAVTLPFGAGDAKYLAVAAPLIEPSHVNVVIFLLSACLLAGLITHRTLARIPAVRRMTPDWVSWVRIKKFPMGIAISATLMLYLAFVAFPPFYDVFRFSNM